MKYARLENGALIPAPRTASVDGMTVCNPTAEQYLKIGWYPVIFTNPPENPPDSPNMAVGHWEQTETEIRKVWEMKPIPEPKPPAPHVPTLEERLATVEYENREQKQMIAKLSGQTIEGVSPDA